MASRRASLLRALARVLGLALVVYVVATQVRWHDRLALADGTTLVGAVEETAGGFSVVPSDGGPARAVAGAEVAHARYGGRDLPDVSYGVPTLVRRLSGSWAVVAGVLVALVALALVTAWRWRWLVLALGVPLSVADALRFTMYGVFFNLFVPGSTGGDVVKAWYAARRTGFPTKAVVSVLVDRVVGLFALVLFAAAVLFLGPDRPGFHAPRLLVGGVLAAAAVGGVLVLSRRVRRALGLSALLRRLPFQRVLGEVDAAVRLYRGHPGSLGLGLAVSLANHAGTAWCAYALARALGLTEVSVGDALALVPVVSLLSAVPLLPGGWGVGELAFAYFFSPLGVAPSEAVALSVVFRLAILASGLPGAVMWLLAREGASRDAMAAEMGAAADAAAVETP